LILDPDFPGSPGKLSSSVWISLMKIKMIYTQKKANTTTTTTTEFFKWYKKAGKTDLRPKN